MPFTKQFENMLRNKRREVGDYAEGTAKAFEIALRDGIEITRERKPYGSSVNHQKRNGIFGWENI